MLDAGGPHRRLELQPHHLRRERHDADRRRRVRGGPERPDRAGDAALHEPDVSHFALLVRLAPADGDQHPVAVSRVRDVGPAPRAHLAPPHPRHEEESRDHGVEATPLEPPTRPLGGQRGHPSGSMSSAADDVAACGSAWRTSAPEARRGRGRRAVHPRQACGSGTRQYGLSSSPSTRRGRRLGRSQRSRDGDCGSDLVAFVFERAVIPS